LSRLIDGVWEFYGSHVSLLWFTMSGRVRLAFVGIVPELWYCCDVHGKSDKLINYDRHSNEPPILTSMMILRSPDQPVGTRKAASSPCVETVGRSARARSQLATGFARSWRGHRLDASIYSATTAVCVQRVNPGWAIGEAPHE
jgi:hypothetical protein